MFLSGLWIESARWLAEEQRVRVIRGDITVTTTNTTAPAGVPRAPISRPRSLLYQGLAASRTPGGCLHNLTKARRLPFGVCAHMTTAHPCAHSSSTQPCARLAGDGQAASLTRFFFCLDRNQRMWTPRRHPSWYFTSVKSS